MPNLKSLLVKKRRDIFFFIICVLLICSLAFFWPKIKTTIWHIEYPNPISWNKLIISVPENLVAQKMEGHLEMLLIFSYISPGYGITIEKDTQSSFQSLIDFFRSQEYLIEDIPCKISGKNCLWIKAMNDKLKIPYTEEIFINDMGIRISFIGSKEQRRDLLKLIENLKFAKK